MNTEEVASSELRRIVENLKINGLPKAEPVTEKLIEKLSDSQRAILKETILQSGEEKNIALEGKCPTQGDGWWNIRLKMREVLQKAICNSMIHLGIIQRSAVFYGAIPDPNVNWRFFRLPDGIYSCWKCGEAILVKNQSASLHFAEFGHALTGGGEVVNNQIPYCPKCDGEPPDSTIITETVAETFARENPQLCR